STDLKIDTIFQPLFSLTDHLAKYLGRLFICLFLCIIAAITYVFYFCIFQHIYFDKEQHTFFMFLFHFIFGHWLLINILFNYIQVVRTDPGSSSNFGKSKSCNFTLTNKDSSSKHDHNNSDNNNNISNLTTIIQLSKKNDKNTDDKYYNNRHESNYNQLREHDDSNNTKDVLLMLESSTLKLSDSFLVYNKQFQIQRHLNHRYFFQFCFFMTLGSFYTATLGFTEYQHHMFGEKYYSYLDLVLGKRIVENDLLSSFNNPSMHFTMLYLFIVCASACLILFFFTLWHFWLISRAETTIEYHVNSVERKRLKELKLNFQNPYNLGFKTNWQLFLGFHHFYDILYKNLLPSTHRPFSDGIHWPMRTYIHEKYPLLSV
ncbi:unnamed protein product, partial [Didymodactylos carnosus]